MPMPPWMQDSGTEMGLCHILHCWQPQIPETAQRLQSRSIQFLAAWFHRAIASDARRHVLRGHDRFDDKGNKVPDPDVKLASILVISGPSVEGRCCSSELSWILSAADELLCQHGRGRSLSAAFGKRPTDWTREGARALPFLLKNQGADSRGLGRSGRRGCGCSFCGSALAVLCSPSFWEGFVMKPRQQSAEQQRVV